MPEVAVFCDGGFDTRIDKAKAVGNLRPGCGDGGHDAQHEQIGAVLDGVRLADDGR